VAVVSVLSLVRRTISMKFGTICEIEGPCAVVMLLLPSIILDGIDLKNRESVDNLYKIVGNCG